MPRAKRTSKQQTEFDLSQYRKLTVDFILRNYEAYTFEFSRTVRDAPVVHFSVQGNQPQMLAVDNVPSEPAESITDHEARIRLPKSRPFDVTFTSKGQPLFIVQLDGEKGETRAWFTTFDSSGYQVSALCLAIPGTVHLSSYYGEKGGKP